MRTDLLGKYVWYLSHENRICTGRLAGYFTKHIVEIKTDDATRLYIDERLISPTLKGMKKVIDMRIHHYDRLIQALGVQKDNIGAMEEVERLNIKPGEV